MLLGFAVDKFHFKKNHTAAYCELYTNPCKVDLLNDPRCNMSIAEQRFKHVARYKHLFRHGRALLAPFHRYTEVISLHT